MGQLEKKQKQEWTEVMWGDKNWPIKEQGLKGYTTKSLLTMLVLCSVHLIKTHFVMCISTKNTDSFEIWQNLYLSTWFRGLMEFLYIKKINYNFRNLFIELYDLISVYLSV